jgi:DNA-binding CsgD family transcriptional regulator
MACECLTRADADAGLAPDDLWLLGLSGHLIGRDDIFLAALERAHRLHVDNGDCGSAVRCAFWLGLHLADRGENARASGWLARAARILEQDGRECAERGYLLVAEGHRALVSGDIEAAIVLGGEAARLGEQFGDRDLVALAIHMQGRARLAGGDMASGFALLDEAMVAVGTDELSPQLTGLIYCSVIGACRSVYAIARAQEWTAALSDWCESQPELVAYSGECQVYRSELMQLQGSWRDALDEARRAAARAEEAGEAGRAVVALARYQQGEAHRLLGEFAAAESAYHAAGAAGREPQPGMALLRLAQGSRPAALAAIRRALAEAGAPLQRVRLLPAAVEVLLDAGDVEEAARASRELEQFATTYGSSALAAMAAHASGAVALASASPVDALPALRRACATWHQMNAPYEAARARMLLGLACRALNDEDTASIEIATARTEFERLGARPDVRRVDALTRSSAPRERHGLTPRELQVLALVATGQTNRAIAATLFVSEKTVARHVSNMFRKLGVTSRAAATAYAYEHRLLTPHG